MSKPHIEENLMGFESQQDLERAVIKIQKQLNWALDNIDSENTSDALPSDSVITADGRTLVIKNGLIVQII